MCKKEKRKKIDLSAIIEERKRERRWKMNEKKSK